MRTSQRARLLRAETPRALLVVVLLAGFHAATTFASNGGQIQSPLSAAWPPNYQAAIDPVATVDHLVEALAREGAALSQRPETDVSDTRSKLATRFGIAPSSIGLVKLKSAAPAFDLFVVGLPGSLSPSQIARAFDQNAPQRAAAVILGRSVTISGSVVVYQVAGATFAIVGPEPVVREVLRRLP